MGRRQVVRQRILIPSCGGSNPPAPARDRWRSRPGLPAAMPAVAPPLALTIARDFTCLQARQAKIMSSNSASAGARLATIRNAAWVTRPASRIGTGKPPDSRPKVRRHRGSPPPPPASDAGTGRNTVLPVRDANRHGHGRIVNGLASPPRIRQTAPCPSARRRGPGCWPMVPGERRLQADRPIMRCPSEAQSSAVAACRRALLRGSYHR